MVIDMNEKQLKTVAQLRAFLDGTLEVRFEPIGEDTQRYELIAAVLRRFRYRRLKRPDKGVVLRYLEHTTGYSRQQLTRLVCRVLEGGNLAKRYAAPAKGFTRKFTPEDVTLLAETDALHGTLSGPATRCLMQRAFHVFGDVRYERLATICVAHPGVATRRGGCTGLRPRVTTCQLLSAAPQRPRAARASSALTVATPATRTALRASTTSTPSIA